LWTIFISFIAADLFSRQPHSYDHPLSHSFREITGTLVFAPHLEYISPYLRELHSGLSGTLGASLEPNSVQRCHPIAVTVGSDPGGEEDCVPVIAQISRLVCACTPINTYISHAAIHLSRLSDLQRIMQHVQVQSRFPLELICTYSIVVVSGSKSSSVSHMDCANPTNVSYISMAGCTCSSS
jgi:hypothetical protein